jgi:hypothetical protein
LVVRKTVAGCPLPVTGLKDRLREMLFMAGKKIFMPGLAIFLFSGWGLGWAYAQGSSGGQAIQYKNHGETVLSSAAQPVAAQETAPPKTPAAEDSTLTGKMLKGKAVPPARKDKPYPAPELKKPGAKDKPYPAPEVKRPAEPQKPAVAAPTPPIPPAKTSPVPATPPEGSKSSKDGG